MPRPVGGVSVVAASRPVGGVSVVAASRPVGGVSVVAAPRPVGGVSVVAVPRPVGGVSVVAVPRLHGVPVSGIVKSASVFSYWPLPVGPRSCRLLTLIQFISDCESSKYENRLIDV